MIYDAKMLELHSWESLGFGPYCFSSLDKLPVPRLHGRLGQVRCRKGSWGCFGGRHLLEFFVVLCFGRCGQM